MTDDILHVAARALRDTTEGAAASARFTRARVLATVHQQRRRRFTRAVVLVPLAAILLGGSAWAAAGGTVPAVVVSVVEAVGLRRPPPPAAPAQVAPPRLRGSALPPAPAVLDPAEVEAPESEADPETPPVEVPDPAPASPARPAHTAPRTPAAPSATTSADARADALYAAAHHAHFERHDPAAALASWNEYLRVAPRGRFALEATYNRAICLVRLGRTDAALQALTPFAEGRYGGYRQQEATRLVRALRGEEDADSISD